MFDQGLLKVGDDGQYKVVEDKDERDFIQESARKSQQSQMSQQFDDNDIRSAGTHNNPDMLQGIRLEDDPEFK